MNPVNKVVFSRREYPNKDDLYQAIANQVRILLESGYTLVASKEDEVGDGISIEYSIVKSNNDWPRPFWLVKNEMIAAADEHINNEVTNAQQIIESADNAETLVNKAMTLFNKKKNDGDDGSGGYEA